MEYIIAYYNRGGNLTGFKLMNLKLMRVRNVTADNLAAYLRNGGKVRNLELGTDGQFKWVQGAKDRYPEIRTDEGTVVRKNSYTVLGKYESTDTYLVANYEGKCAEFNRETLYESVDQGSVLTNTKLSVTKGEIKVTSLGGDMHQLNEGVQLSYDPYHRVITVDMPNKRIDKLEIPGVIGGNFLENPYQIEFTQPARALEIQHIKIGAGIKNLNLGMLNIFPNLITLNIDGVVSYNGRLDAPRLQAIRVKGIDRGIIRNGLFGDKPNLTKVVLETGITAVLDEAFSGCTKLKIQDILNKGAIIVGSNAFRGCADEKLELPETLTKLEYTAFNEMKNLKEIDIKHETIAIEADKYYMNYRNRGGDKQEGKEFLSGTNGIHVYIPYGLKMDIDIADNVVIHTKDKDDQHQNVQNKLTKARVLGYDLEAYEEIDSMDKMGEFLSIIGEASWRDIVMQVVKNYMKGINESVYGSDKFKIKVTLGHRRYGRTEVIKATQSEDFIIIWLKGELRVINKSASKALEGSFREIGGYYGKESDTYNIPCHIIYNSSHNPVVNIVQQGEELILTRKYKNLREVIK